MVANKGKRTVYLQWIYVFGCVFEMLRMCCQINEYVTKWKTITRQLKLSLILVQTNKLTKLTKSIYQLISCLIRTKTVETTIRHLQGISLYAMLTGC